MKKFSIGAALSACAISGCLMTSNVAAQDASQLYVGGALTFSEVTVTPGGFNTVGFFSNAVGSQSQDANGISINLGLDNLYQFGNGIRLRGELEFNRSELDGCGGSPLCTAVGGGSANPNLITGSFPGPPGPFAFFYRAEVETYNGFANVFLDFDLPVFDAPLGVFVGGGVGFSVHDVTVSDAVVRGSNSDTEFAWHAGGGVKYAITDSVEIFAAGRYMDLGTSDTPLVSVVGAAPGGNYTLEHTVIEGRVGLNVKLGALFGN